MRPVEEWINVRLVKPLAYSYDNQEISVLWNNVRSNAFAVGHGTKQGGVLSPYLLTRYIRVLLYAVASSRYGCRVSNISANIFAYAMIVCYLLAPSRHALQLLISTVQCYIVSHF